MNVAIVGASGAVGKEMINCLHSEGVTVSRLGLFGSKNSAGRVFSTPFGEIVVEEFSLDKVSTYSIVLLAVSGEFSLVWAPQLVAKGCLVIDNSSAFRYQGEVPLVVPEINFHHVVGGQANIIANPNCTTAICAMVLSPLRCFGIDSLICSTYQAASGAGDKGMAELESAISAHHLQTTFTPTVFSHNICTNVIPAIDKPLPNGYTKEEMKLVWETQKIFDSPSWKISSTAVRVPTSRAHCVAATIVFGGPVNVHDVRERLANAPGVELIDDINNGFFPTPQLATSNPNVLVGRIRQNLVFGEKGIDLFIAGDQLLRGAALNAVRIAQKVHTKEASVFNHDRRRSKDTVCM